MHTAWRIIELQYVKRIRTLPYSPVNNFVEHVPWRTPELRYTQWIGRRNGVTLALIQKPWITPQASRVDMMRQSSQRENRNTDVMSFGIKGPPNSPPIDFTRLTNSTRITKQASLQNRVTEKAKLRHERKSSGCSRAISKKR